MKNYKLAVVGATGLVGRKALEVLEEYKLPISEYVFFASERSAGSKLEFNGKEYEVQLLTENSFDQGFDFAIFSAGGDTSRHFAPWNKGIIANPNCSTIQAVLPLKVLDDKYKIKRIVYSTYQAVSGAGKKGVDDLENGLKGEKPQKFPHPIVNNCLPHIDVFLDNGYTKEEEKMINETRKILNHPDLKITATCVRVPVLNSHSESINVEFEKEFDIEELKNVLKSGTNIIVEDDPENNVYPLAANVTGHDEVYVGRIRRDFSVENGINFWCVGDNIRKGAASNAIQIVEKLIEYDNK